MEPGRPLLDRPAACVIAQQYSSACSFSLRLNSRKENFGASLKNGVILIVVLIQNCVIRKFLLL
jgi:hypothetical protein